MPISTVNIMLTSFITSQHGHGGYLCMLINNLNVQERVHLPLSSLSLAGQTFAREARNYRDYLPVFLLFSPSLSFPIQPLHSPSTRWTTDRNGVSISTVCTATAPLSRSKTAKAAWCLDSRLRVYEQHSESGTTEEAPVSEGLSKETAALETQEKRQRRNHAHHCQELARARFRPIDSRQNLDANQSN